MSNRIPTDMSAHMSSGISNHLPTHTSTHMSTHMSSRMSTNMSTYTTADHDAGRYRQREEDLRRSADPNLEPVRNKKNIALSTGSRALRSGRKTELRPAVVPAVWLQLVCASTHAHTHACTHTSTHARSLNDRSAEAEKLSPYFRLPCLICCYHQNVAGVRC